MSSKHKLQNTFILLLFHFEAMTVTAAVRTASKRATQRHYSASLKAPIWRMTTRTHTHPRDLTSRLLQRLSQQRVFSSSSRVVQHHDPHRPPPSPRPPEPQPAAIAPPLGSCHPGALHAAGGPLQQGTDRPSDRQTDRPTAATGFGGGRAEAAECGTDQDQQGR